MKVKFSIASIFVIFLLALQSCGDDPKPTPPKSAEDLAIEALAGIGTKTWTLIGGSITKNNIDITSSYSGFELVFNAGTSKTYTSKNSNDLFDGNGNWEFAGANFDKFILSGTKPVAGREISFTESSGKLTLVFTIPEPGARITETQAVAGNYVFVLNKK